MYRVSKYQVSKYYKYINFMELYCRYQLTIVLNYLIISNQIIALLVRCRFVFAMSQLSALSLKFLPGWTGEVIRKSSWQLFVKYKKDQFVLVLPQPNIIGEMENLETDLVRGEGRKVGERSHLQSLRSKVANSTNKIRNCAKTLAVLSEPNNLL